MDNLKSILNEGKISKIEYKTYLTFMGNDVAREFLAFMLESIVMEEPSTPTNDLFAWHDGRRSVWRDIKVMINKVNDILENYDVGHSNPNLNQPGGHSFNEWERQHSNGISR